MAARAPPRQSGGCGKFRLCSQPRKVDPSVPRFTFLGLFVRPMREEFVETPFPLETRRQGQMWSSWERRGLYQACISRRCRGCREQSAGLVPRCPNPPGAAQSRGTGLSLRVSLLAARDRPGDGVWEGGVRRGGRRARGCVAAGRAVW